MDDEYYEKRITDRIKELKEYKREWEYVMDKLTTTPIHKQRLHHIQTRLDEVELLLKPKGVLIIHATNFKQLEKKWKQLQKAAKTDPVQIGFRKPWWKFW